MLSRALNKTAQFGRSFYDDFKEFLSPSVCLCCGRDRDFSDPILCPACLDILNRDNSGYGPICPMCADHLKSKPSNHVSHSDHLIMYYWGVYEKELQACLLRFKFSNAIELGKRLAQLALPSLLERIGADRFDIIVPVPLHKTRKRERYFNQSEIIARELGQLMNIPVDLDILARARATMQQAKLDEGERWNNVKDAFVVSIRAGELVRGKSILLVDDIVTTGATAYEASRPIMAAEPKRLEIFSLAYAR